MEMITIPKGGRPRKRMTPKEATILLQEREQMTVQSLAAWHSVSESTMYRMLRRAEEVLNDASN